MLLKWFKLLNVSAREWCICASGWNYVIFCFCFHVKLFIIQHSKALQFFWLKKNKWFKLLLFVVCAWVTIHSIHWQCKWSSQLTWHKYKLNSSPTGNLLFDSFNEEEKILSRKKCRRKQSPVRHLWFTSYETKINTITKAFSFDSTGGLKFILIEFHIVFVCVFISVGHMQVTK